MKSNNSRDNFFTALKNGKFGVFRAEMSLDQIRGYLQHLDAGHTEGFYYGDGFEIYFDARLRRVKFDFGVLATKEYSIKNLANLQMDWTEYLMKCTPVSLYNDIKESGIQCFYMEHESETKIFHSFKSPNALQIFFCKDEPTLLVIEFEDEFKCIRGFKKVERLG